MSPKDFVFKELENDNLDTVSLSGTMKYKLAKYYNTGKKSPLPSSGLTVDFCHPYSS